MSDTPEQKRNLAEFQKKYYDKKKVDLPVGKCKKCGFAYGQHAIASPEEVEFLRSIGYNVFVCKDIIEENPFLEGDYLEVVATTKDDEFLDGDEIEQLYKNREPGDPCDEEFMEEISS